MFHRALRKCLERPVSGTRRLGGPVLVCGHTSNIDRGRVEPGKIRSSVHHLPTTAVRHAMNSPLVRRRRNSTFKTRLERGT